MQRTNIDVMNSQSPSPEHSNAVNLFYVQAAYLGKIVSVIAFICEHIYINKLVASKSCKISGDWWEYYLWKWECHPKYFRYWILHESEVQEYATTSFRRNALSNQKCRNGSVTRIHYSCTWTFRRDNIDRSKILNRILSGRRYFQHLTALLKFHLTLLFYEL